MTFCHDLYGQVIQATFSLNLLRNIVTFQVEKRCCRPPRSSLRVKINSAAFKIKLTCIASVSAQVRRENWDERKKKGMRGEGEGSEGNASPQTPRF